MAYIYERTNTKSKTYFIHWYYGGKLYRERVGGNKEAAKMRLGEITRKIEMGQFSVHSDAPLSELIKHFREHLSAESHSEGYTRRLEVIFRHYERYFDAKRINNVSQVDYPLLDNYVTQRITEDGISGKTVNMEIDLFKNLFDFAVKHKYIMENPASDLKRKKVKKSKPRYFSNEEVGLLLDNSGKYETFFMVLLHTGLRASDAGNLKWSDIDLERGFINSDKGASE